MTQGERLRQLRKDLSLTLVEFGAKLGVGKSAISDIENNRRGITDQMAKSICREYNVNYDWLIHGEGDMYSALKESTLDEICDQYDLSDLEKKAVKSFLTLDPNVRAATLKHLKKIFFDDDGSENKN